MRQAEHVQAKRKAFRTADMGGLFSPDIDGFLAAFQEALESASVRA